jgi:hypothetical protein
MRHEDGGGLVVECDDLELVLLAADREALGVDFAGRHLHAVEHVLAVQRGTAGQGARVADLHDLLGERAATRHGCGSGGDQQLLEVGYECHLSLLWWNVIKRQARLCGVSTWRGARG